ncbi:unnamed protein product [Orchesella dallaii]|uniref:Uncharacterized protein n=1 Tax=Orchesella dallaii TaxID=48710 RepID=A0ABP1R0I0_9HEXA
MSGNQYSEIITMIDVSSFHQKEHLTFKHDLIEHVKEAISLQISRNAITNRKLVQLGLEPNLSRILWSYGFFDSTRKSNQELCSGRPMQRLTYEHWDLFEEELNKEVKSYSATNYVEIPIADRVKNIITVLQQLRLNGGSKPDSVEETNVAARANSYHRDKIVFMFTTVPTLFANLVHLASGVNAWKHSISALGYKPGDIQICFIDIKFDFIATRGSSDMDAVPCFWDDFNFKHGEQKIIDLNLILKVSCLRKIIMIHSLMELRFPWRCCCSFRESFGFGMGMKRLKLWGVPQRAQRLPISPKVPRCLTLRKCWSESYSY